MLESAANEKYVHNAITMSADPYQEALDSGMDAVEPETPHEVSPNNVGCLSDPAVRRVTGLARSQKKFGVEIIGVLDSERVNGYHRCQFLCSDGSILSDDATEGELATLPKIRTGSAWDEWIGGGYPTNPIIEEAFFKMENKEDLASCAICGRTLTAPKSVRRQIGPECLRRVGGLGNTFVDGQTISDELIRASEQYSDKVFQCWVIEAVLTLNAPLPDATLEWRGEEYFGYRNKPVLYYLDTDGNLNCLEKRRRKLVHRKITAENCRTTLDRRALAMISKKPENEGSNPIIISEIPEEEKSPYSKREWFIKQGNRRIIIFEEKGKLWCNCWEKDCEHLKALKDGGWLKK